MSKPAITVVIPVHNAADRLDRVVGWRTTLDKCGRTYEILVVDDGSTDGTGEKLLTKEPRARILRHDTRKGFGVCLRTALAEAKHPLFFYTALDYPYTPGDMRVMLERIELKDEILGKQPDLVSGCRTGLPTPFLPNWLGKAWRGFWRVFAGMPIQEPAPWHGWTEFWYKSRVSWYYGVPLADVNSCFKLFRTDFLKRFPIQSDGDFVHTELVAKATFLTSIMDEVKLTPKPDALPVLGSTSADRKRLSPTGAQFAFPTTNPPVADAPGSPKVEAPVADAPGSPIPAPAPLP
jgi:Glycosyl transferase family 2